MLNNFNLKKTFRINIFFNLIIHEKKNMCILLFVFKHLTSVIFAEHNTSMTLNVKIKSSAFFFFCAYFLMHPTQGVN